MARPEDETKQPHRRFVIGCDHAGYELKERVRTFLAEAGHEVDDAVPEFHERIDWGPVAERVASTVAGDRDATGILICGTGLAMSMAANKVPGVRAALLYDEYAAEYARRHNNANILVFGGRTMAFPQVVRRLEAFFGQEFEGGKYAERNAFMADMQKRHGCEG